MKIFHLFFYSFFFLFVFYFLVNSMTSNLMIWWSVFIVMTLSFIFLHKMQGDFSNSLNYFVLQEFLGFLFLIMVGLLLQFLIFMMKVGVAPLHFWIFSVFSGVENYILMWFLTMQKLPFLPVFVYFLKFLFMFLLMLGILFCYFHLFVMKNYKFMLALSSTESFNWILLGIFMGIWGFLFMSFYYIMNMVLLLNYQLWGFQMNYYLEMSLVFMNLPLTFMFFLKIFMMSLSINIMIFFLLFLIMMMTLSSLSFMGWLVSFSTSLLKKYQDQMNISMMLFFTTFFLVYFFHFSKKIMLLW